jgi:putative hemolysin
MNITKNVIFSIIIITFIIFGCTKKPDISLANKNQTAMANPASTKCINDGGVDKILFGPDGEYAICLFPDGTVCDEWKYYKNECTKGECERKCNFIGTRSEGWYDCNGKLLFYDLCANETAATAGSC